MFGEDRGDVRSRGDVCKDEAVREVDQHVVHHVL
ncbi:hypothetical protein ROA7450_01295 [Roseovarius albus]|uniref:Uncharacterized protein n=1 Tax=Roseovarius albus TaxID=1247867 RepID=A0A1X6YSB5_9RHOB|nr:hypothetical protein ROA7450_01295 [Roseovarius albus]